MKKWVHKVEIIVDKIIPYLLVLLMGLIVIEVFFHEFALAYHYWVEGLDFFIIFVFVVDLLFKYERTKNIPLFLKKYWLDIIAVFPFFLVFRLFEETALIFNVIGESLKTPQQILHTGVEGEKIIKVVSEEAKELKLIEKEGARIISEIEKSGALARSEKLARFIRPGARSTRFFKFLSKDTRKSVKKEGSRDIQAIKRLEKNLEKQEKNLERKVKKEYKTVMASIFYEKPSGKHHVHE